MNQLTLQWIAHNADKKGLQKFIKNEYGRIEAKEIKKEPSQEKVKNDWERLKKAFGGKLR